MQILILLFITLVGFVFRLFGIIDMHSFWTDESNVALYAKAIQETGLPVLNTGYTMGLYQAGYYYLLAFFGFFGGINEFTLRLPSVIFGTLSVFLSGILIWKLTKSQVASIFTALLFSFSQVQLAYSTQARPYIIIQAVSFLIFYIFLIEEKAALRKKILCFSLNIILGLAALLLHPTGFLLLLSILAYYLLTYFKLIKKHLNLLIIIPAALLVLLLSYLLNLHFWAGIVLSKITQGLTINNTPYLKELLWAQYGFIFLPAVVGFLFLARKSLRFSLTLIFWFGPLLFLWLFIHYSHNIRYLVPLLGWILILFCYFWYQVSTLLPKKSWIIFLIVLTILITGSNKFVRIQGLYYSPNADFPSDVQMANYKEVYNQLNLRYGDKLSEYALFDDWNDRTLWYLNRKPDAIFVKDGTYGNTYPVNDPLSGSVFYTTLGQFKNQQSLYPKGIVFVEDWQSIMPDDIKGYIKNNLKFEFRVEGVDNSKGDNWPIEVYSWGDSYD